MISCKSTEYKQFKRTVTCSQTKFQNMQEDSKKHDTPTYANNVLVAGLVRVIKTPISERYCKVGDEATLDLKNKQIRCGGAWFNFDERWLVQPCN